MGAVFALDLNPPKAYTYTQAFTHTEATPDAAPAAYSVTRGHGSHTLAALWKDQLVDLLKETEK